MKNAAAVKAQSTAGANGATGSLREILQTDKDSTDSPQFPHLENLLMTLRKNPYAAIGAMIAVASIIVVALTTVSVAMFTAIILLYGQVRENNALMATALTKIGHVETAQTDAGNVMRAYEAMNAKQTMFMVGLMNPQQQKQFFEFQKNNPIPPATERNE